VTVGEARPGFTTGIDHRGELELGARADDIRVQLADDSRTHERNGNRCHECLLVE
jgi:alpha-D-ribose 1-methylphosphonate 5-triphosphate diphosphatase PhnM